MEPEQIALIDANILQLTKETYPSTVFLKTLECRDILGDADLDKLESCLSRHAKNCELYTILKTRTGAFNNLLCALNTTNQTGLRDKLYYGNSGADKEISSTGRNPFVCSIDGCSTTKLATPIINPIYFHVTPPSNHFTGRVEFLEKIRNIFSNSGTAAIICQSIVGLGGIGKTDLARKAVDHYIRRDENNDLNVVWFSAETEQDLTSDFITLAKDEKELGVNIKDSAGGEKEIQSIVKEVYTYFKDKRCLFVFDNAENEEYLLKFLPSSYAFLFVKSTCRQPMMLITSRDNEWSSTLNSTVVKLDLFSENEAILFVQKVLMLENGSSNSSIELEFVKQLIGKLEFLPLAIKQAAFYIAEQMKVDIKYGVKTYLEEWEQNCQKLLNKKIVAEHKTTYTTWKTTINKIAKDESCGQVAVDVLRKLAFMTSDGIVLELFQGNDWLDISSIREAFALLVRYSMISRHACSGFSIHRLVQEVTRIDMRLNGSEEYELDKTLSMLTEEISSVNLSQVQSAWHHAKRYRKLAVKYSGAPNKISNLLWPLKGLRFGMEFAKQELEFLSKTLPDENHLSILNLEAKHCTYMNALGRGDSGYDKLWKKVEIVLRSGSVSEWELVNLLLFFCHMDSEKRRYPDAWSRLDKNLRTVDVSSCDEIRAYEIFEYGFCLYFAIDFASSTNFFKNALSIIDRTQSKDTNFKQQLEHWLKLASLYTCRSDNTQASISELLHSLCLLLARNREQPIENLNIAFQTSTLLFSKFGMIDESLSICRYYLFIRTEPGVVSFFVPNTLNQISIFLCEQGNFQEALVCSLEANSLFKNMQHYNKTFDELEYKIHLARALGGVGREVESLNIITEVLPELLNLERRDINLLHLILMNLVAAEVLLNNHETLLALKVVNRADKLLSTLPIDVSMPFLSNKLCQIKEKLAAESTSEVKTQSIESLDSIMGAPTKKRRII